ncbi:MAG: hypothetical protein QOF02_2607 [Blastocatellia bacterium]|jgi:uncharacterized protein (DUF885 family)|nr:hypothetical protein [Blastocatellia bacterium]
MTISLLKQAAVLMKRKILALLAALACGLLAAPATVSDVAAQARSRRVTRAAGSSSSSTIAARFNQIADAYLRGYYAFNPTEATALGLHDYDGQLESRSPEAVALETKRLRSALGELLRINPAGLAPEARYDYLVLSSHARAQLLELEEIRMWRRDPNVYNGLLASSVDNILKRNYAPIEQRLESVLRREREIPRLLREARLNLEQPPRIYTEVALNQARGSLDYFSRVVPQMIERAGGARLNAERRAQFEATNQNVIGELRSFAEWLERDLLPRSTGSFAIGAENFRRKLLYEEMVETPLVQLLREGETELRRTQDAMRELAEEIAPGKGVDFALRLLGREHPSAGGLVGETRAELDRIRSFVRAQNILTPPLRENLTVAETPEYARSTSFASMDAPGPFERVATEAYYYVTPPDAALDARGLEEHLSFYNRYALPVISIHEVYPGHYYQGLALRQQPSRVRTALASASFVEGWAHYCEQMLLDEGFGGNNPKLRLAQLNLALLRLCRYVVGLRLHTQGMSYDEGVNFFMREGYQERVNAEREARRGTLDPTYLVYTLGKMEIIKLREEWKARAGEAFRLGEFHDRLLSYGMPPIKIIRLAMLGESKPLSGPPTEETASKTTGFEDFSVVATGNQSKRAGARAVELVVNQSDWQRVWRAIGDERNAPPDINFNTQAVIVVYQGQSADNAGIAVEKIRRDSQMITIKTAEQKAGSVASRATEAASPFVAVSFPRPPEGSVVRFDNDEEVIKAEQNRYEKKRSLRPRRKIRRR